jgi:hypothetical protein
VKQKKKYIYIKFGDDTLVNATAKICFAGLKFDQVSGRRGVTKLRDETNELAKYNECVGGSVTRAKSNG